MEKKNLQLICGELNDGFDTALQMLGFDTTQLNAQEIQNKVNELKQNGQIVFETFNEQYTHNNFMERLNNICNNAKSELNNTSNCVIDFSKDLYRIYTLPSGKRSNDYFEECINNNCIKASEGYGAEEIKDKVKEGDYIIIPSAIDGKKSRTIRAFGVIKGNTREVEADKGEKGVVDWVYRDVEWLWFAKDEESIIEFSKDELNLGLSTFQKVNKQEYKDNIFNRFNTITNGISHKSYILIIDEINKGKISEIFGETIELIKPNNLSEIKLQNSEELFSIPRNLCIVGIVRSEDEISDELKNLFQIQKGENMSKYAPQNREELDELIKEESISLGNIDVSNITEMDSLFENSTRQDFSGIENWDTSNVTTMLSMFNGCEHFNADISGWNVSSVEDMGHMFEGCKEFNADISGWDVSNVTCFWGMFKDTEKFDCDISDWTISEDVEEIDEMFYNAKGFTYDLSNWTNCEYDDGWCRGNSNFEDCENVFTGCPAPKPSWYIYDMDEEYFENIEKDEDDKYYPNTNEELKALVRNEDISLADINVSKITDFNNVFKARVDHKDYDTILWEREDYDGIETWNVSNAETMECMFQWTTQFKNGISDWEMSNVKSIRSMFYGATGFDEDISNWNIQSLEYMDDAFRGATSFDQDLDSWDISNVSDMTCAFYDDCPTQPSWYED